MPRANRHFLPGHVWHITQLCSSPFQWFDKLTTNGNLMLRSGQNVIGRCVSTVPEVPRFPDKRFGLSVLNYMVTSNHIHLLVKDTGSEVTET
jgi:putative transposase